MYEMDKQSKEKKFENLFFFSSISEILLMIQSGWHFASNFSKLYLLSIKSLIQQIELHPSILKVISGQFNYVYFTCNVLHLNEILYFRNKPVHGNIWKTAKHSFAQQLTEKQSSNQNKIYLFNLIQNLVIFVKTCYQLVSYLLEYRLLSLPIRYLLIDQKQFHLTIEIIDCPQLASSFSVIVSQIIFALSETSLDN